MKAVSPQPVQASYQRHRRQVASQIILPMVLAAILCAAASVALVIVTLFQNHGDLSRWAAISTMWILVPVILAGLLLLVVLLALIYLLARLLGILPAYTGMAQQFVEKLGAHITRLADASAKPVMFLDSVAASLKAIFGRK